MSALAVEDDFEDRRPLASRLEPVAGGLEDHGEVPGDQVGPLREEPGQPAALGAQLLTVVKDEGSVARIALHLLGQEEHHRQPALHVDGAQPGQLIVLDAGALHPGYGVEMAGQDHPAGESAAGAGNHAVADAIDAQSAAAGAQAGLDEAGQGLLRAADRGDGDQARRQPEQVRLVLRREAMLTGHRAAVLNAHPTRTRRHRALMPRKRGLVRWRRTGPAGRSQARGR